MGSALPAIENATPGTGEASDPIRPTDDRLGRQKRRILIVVRSSRQVLTCRTGRAHWPKTNHLIGTYRSRPVG